VNRAAATAIEGRCPMHDGFYAARAAFGQSILVRFCGKDSASGYNAGRQGGQVMQPWNADKQLQLDDLRRKEQAGGLTEEEQAQLAQLFGELEQEEWRTLGPALERMRRQQAELQRERAAASAQNAVLAAIAERQNDLLARAKAQLSTLLSEQRILRTEYERALTQLSQ
jgi:hypothetical protein